MSTEGRCCCSELCGVEELEEFDGKSIGSALLFVQEVYWQFNLGNFASRFPARCGLECVALNRSRAGWFDVSLSPEFLAGGGNVSTSASASATWRLS